MFVILIFFSLIPVVTSCADLSCGENEICVPAGDTYECVCHPDYEGDNCQETGIAPLTVEYSRRILGMFERRV